MAIEIFWISGSPNSWRVLLGAVIRGLEYESRRLDGAKGDLRTPAFLELNPRGKVPVIRDEDFVLYESLPILEYFDNLPGTGTSAPLFGKSIREGAFIRRVISEFECYVREPLEKVALGLLNFAGAAPRVRVSPEELQEAAPRAHRELQSLERLVTASPWLAGERPSAADAAVFPFVRFLVRVGSKAEQRAQELGFLPLSGSYPALQRWVARVEDLPGYDRTYPPHWRSP
jgi:glutathione S-transferase